METPLCNHQENVFEFRDISNITNIRFTMVYRTIIGVILHLFNICSGWLSNFPFSKTFHHNGSAIFGGMYLSWMPGCQQISRQHRPPMSIKSFVQAQHGFWAGDEMVSLCSLIGFNWHVRWPRPARVPLILLGLKVLGVPCDHSKMLLTWSLSSMWD